MFIKRRRLLSTLSVMLFSVIMIMQVSTNVFAITEEQASKNLTIYVYGNMMEKDYTLNGGGSIKGKDLFSGSSDKGYDLNSSSFSSLSSKAQSQVISDIALYSNNAVEKGSETGVQQSTVQNWWKNLQQKPGVGTKFLNEILKDTKPDFVTANLIYQPFSGLVGTALGVGSIVIMSLLSLVMLGDLVYIGIPITRGFLSGKSGEDSKDGKSGARSGAVSWEAISAVNIAEGDDKSSKQALGIYFKRRAIMLVILGICLLYLVQGQIYSFVGWILDMTSGFLGF